METRININNKLKKALSKFHVTSLHINNDILTMLNYNKKYVIKTLNKSKINNYNTIINYNRFEDQEVSLAIQKFINTISKDFTKEELVLFYRNISSLKVERTNNKDICGRYNILKNKIEITNINHIYHELFHVATTIHTKDSEICGFWQYNSSLDDGIGNGLNEGYTQLITERYFDVEDVKDDSYRYEIIVAKALEHIIGKDKMKSLYINANLNGIIKELKNYNSTKEVFCFMNRLDFICNNRYKSNLSYFRQNKVIEYIRYINHFLIVSYIDKLNNDHVTKDQFDKKISEFLDLFITDIVLNDRACNLDILMQYTVDNYSKNKIIKRIYK